MKYYDLRIGDYVKLKENGQNVRVAGLTSKKVRFHKDDESRLYSRKYSEIEPVPFAEMYGDITNADILLVVTEKRNGRELTLGEAHFFKVKDQDGVFTSVDNYTFRYVHEIQNYHYAKYGETLDL